MFFLLHVCIFSLERVVRCNFEIILIDFGVTSCVHIVHQSPEALNGTVLYKHTPCVMHVSVGVCVCVSVCMFVSKTVLHIAYWKKRDQVCYVYASK